MKNIALYCLFISSLIYAGEQDALKKCGANLQKADYEAGIATDKLLNPELLFKNPLHEGKPRMILMRGLPGSGKFIWSRAAMFFGWKVIFLDQYRDRLIAQKLLAGEKIIPRGSTEPVTPNPLDPTHRMAITEEASAWADADFKHALNKRQPILWEGVYDKPNFRVMQLAPARTHGYYTECLSFEADDLAVFLNNVEQRLYIGGRDLSAINLPPEVARARRIAVMGPMFERMRNFPLREESSLVNFQGAPPNNFRHAEFDHPYILGNDFVNETHRIRVVPWDKGMPPTAGIPWSTLTRRKLLDPERIRRTPLYKQTHGVRLVGIDADSTLRVSDSGAVTANHTRDVLFLPGVAERLNQWREEGAVIAIMSNQGGVPNIVPSATADRALWFLTEMLWQAGATVDYMDWAGGNDEAKYRKPNRGMFEMFEHVLQQALGDPQAHIHIPSSVYIGDSAYKKTDQRPEGGPGFDWSNSDRLFAEAGPREEQPIRFLEPDHPEAFNWYKRWNVRRWKDAQHAREVLMQIAAGHGRR